VGGWQPEPFHKDHPLHKVLGDLMYPSVNDDQGTMHHHTGVLRKPDSVVDLGQNNSERNVFRRYALS